MPEVEEPILDLSDFSLRFTPGKNLVDGVGFRVRAGETLCIVGESGCGKSVTALALMGLLPTPPATIASGRAVFEGRDLFRLSEAEMSDLRGARISMIFQEPMTSLNPAFTVGNQLIETVRRHRKVTKAEARALALEMLRKVRIPAPEKRLTDFPHQLSGGMRQRVMIAMALVNEPRLLIADEPTTALDVTIQAQILALIEDLQEETGTAVVLITHDLGRRRGERRRGRRHVRRPHRRNRIGGSDLRRSPAPLHDRPDGGDPLARPALRQARHDPGDGAADRAPAERLPLRAALPLRPAALR